MTFHKRTLSKQELIAGSKNLGGLLLALLVSFNATAATQAQGSSTLPLPGNLTSTTKSDFDGSWAARLRGRDTQDEFNQRTLSIFRLDLTMDYRLAPWLKLNLSPTFKGTSGHAQTELETDANKSLLLIRNASADFLFLKTGQVSAGALNQPEVHSALMMDERAFPGVRASIKPAKGDAFQWGLFAQSVIPTSSSLATNTKEFEPTPSLQSGGIHLGYLGKGIHFKNNLNAFEYRNIPTAVATDSGLLGNTIVTTNSTDARFVYEYKGFEVTSELQVDWNSRLSTTVSAAAIKNGSAPSGQNQGYLLTGKLDYGVSSTLIMTPIFQYFRIEPDTTVASYTDDRFDTNRVGYRMILKATFSKRFRLYGGGGERDVIYQTPVQSREKFYELGLETLDAKF